MARIKFGMMMTDARGKLGGHVFTKTRSGATVRTKVTPVNPQSSAQALVRNRFGTISQSWRGLSEENRRTWNSAVENFKRTNIFGDSYAPSGKNLFQAINTNLLTAGSSIREIPSPPQELGTFLFENVTVNISTNKIFIEVIQELVNASAGRWIIEATQSYSPGRFNFSGSYRVISTDLAGDEPLDNAITQGDIYTSYVGVFGIPIQGQKVSFRLSVIDSNTGISTPRAIVTTIVS